MKQISVILIAAVIVVAAQVADEYCFRFTWLGPQYNAQSNFFNGTCDEVTKGAEVPCVRPLVVTETGRLPNTSYMWDHFNTSEVACRLTAGSVCVKHTYYYNDAVENITYMCSKVRIENGGPVESNCYSEFQNGREIEVCVCLSHGGYPCNAGTSNYYFQFGVIYMMLFKLFLFLFIF